MTVMLEASTSYELSLIRRSSAVSHVQGGRVKPGVPIWWGASAIVWERTNIDAIATAYNSLLLNTNILESTFD